MNYNIKRLRFDFNVIYLDEMQKLYMRFSKTSSEFNFDWNYLDGMKRIDLAFSKTFSHWIKSPIIITRKM